MQKNIINLLKKSQIPPIKRLGQNFLISEFILKKIVEAAEVSKKDNVLEVGPGIGNLTIELAKKVKKVIAVEKDKRMIEVLKKNLNSFQNIKIVNEDILKLDPKTYSLKPYKIVANIPYYLTSRLIRKFLEAKNQPKEMILMVQKEVAKRICATPPEMNLLAVSVRFYAKPEILFYVPKKSFWPQPKVDGAVIKIVTRDKRQKIKVNRELFFRIVKAGFSHPRKQIINNLSEVLNLDKERVGEWLLKNEVKPSQRAETFNIGDWVRLTKSYFLLK